ncbi:hypothetical protein [Argonema antarcticum]|uniref:hypothetical protein n=1 Tax=Argonema antarcticum TaxID=2942763 RepID=UPI002010D61C|nr:hypothetical protein [Argonema antarcticum]MCL1475963.1 hypothetical protein [Argonema antarcticum A004/B2]
MKSLIALFVPGVAFYICLSLLWNHPQFTWLHDWGAYPWEFWGISFCGIVATIAGVIDWLYHRKKLRIVGELERKYEMLALAGGVPLFILMAVASLIEKPTNFLIPVIIVVLYMTVLICYDEFLFHRRCKPFETTMHRLLVFGNGFAWLAWAHWCFVRGGAYV